MFQMKVQVFSGTCPIPIINVKLGTVGSCYYPKHFFKLSTNGFILKNVGFFPTEFPTEFPKLFLLGKSLAQSVKWVRGRQKIETDWFGRGCENDYEI